jgi:hypothetical protein
MLFPLETTLNRCQLTIIAHSFLFESLNDLLVSLLDGLRLIVLDHHLIQPILQNADGSHHWVLFNET